MSDYCVFCDTRRPQGGTNHLVLNGGKTWLEFCTRCGDREWMINGLTGEKITVYNLFARGTELPQREPTQSYEEWAGEVTAQAQASPEPSHPTLADIWPT